MQQGEQEMPPTCNPQPRESPTPVQAKKPGWKIAFSFLRLLERILLFCFRCGFLSGFSFWDRVFASAARKDQAK